MYEKPPENPFEKLYEDLNGIKSVLFKIVDSIENRQKENIYPMTAEQLAEHLHCPVSSIYQFKHQGRLSCTKNGRKLLFTRADVEEFLNTGRHLSDDAIRNSVKLPSKRGGREA